MKLFGYILGMGLILLPHSSIESAVYTKKVHRLNIWNCFVFFFSVLLDPVLHVFVFLCILMLFISISIYEMPSVHLSKDT